MCFVIDSKNEQHPWPCYNITPELWTLEQRRHFAPKQNGRDFKADRYVVFCGGNIVADFFVSNHPADGVIFRKIESKVILNTEDGSIVHRIGNFFDVPATEMQLVAHERQLMKDWTFSGSLNDLIPEEANAFLIDGRNYDRASFMGRAILALSAD